MKNKFAAKAQELSSLAEQFLKDKVKGKIVLFSINKGSTSDDEFLNLPILSRVTKHNIYVQYSVVSIEKNGKDIIFHTIDNGEDGEHRDFNLSELDGENLINLCYIADKISEKV